jgi:hypothetical protein
MKKSGHDPLTTRTPIQDRGFVPSRIDKIPRELKNLSAHRYLYEPEHLFLPITGEAITPFCTGYNPDDLNGGTIAGEKNALPEPGIPRSRSP